MERTRIVFFGTPEYAVPSLRALAANLAVELLLVVTQPDRGAGRGRTTQMSAVKAAALDLGLPVYQPATLRDPESRRPIAAIGADLFVVAAYGLIFGEKTLSLPRFGCINLHASLLPNYRGASPVTAAILAGDRETGVSLMRMERGLDSGPVLATSTVEIGADATTESLTATLAACGATLIDNAVTRHIPQDRVGDRQRSRDATIVRPLVKADGWIDWDEDADTIERRVRAMWTWPRAWTSIGDDLLQIHRVEVINDSHLSGQPPAAPGTVVAIGGQAVVWCGGEAREALHVVMVQPAGRKPMSGEAWLSGQRGEGHRLGQLGVPSQPPPLIVPLVPGS